MKKKYFYFTFTVFFILISLFIFIFFTKPSKSKSIFTNTIPFIKNTTIPTPLISRPTYQSTNTPSQTDMQKIKNQIDEEASRIEKNKIIQALPIRIENFKTSTPLLTTINFFTLSADPKESTRIEIYGINFNNTEIDGKDAIAFKDSFIQLKKTILSRKINLKNLQIIYGNRQYIQDTANYWVNTFKLLD